MWPLKALTKGPIIKAFVWPLLLMTLVALVDCCEIKDLEHNSLTSTSVVLTWNLGDCEGKKVERYKAYPKHLRYKACDAGVKDDAVSAVFETFDTRVTLTELRPYSRYEIEVIAVLSGAQEKEGREKVSGKIRLTTKQGKPETAPGRSSGVREFTQALKFFWLPPSDEDCKNQNGVHDGYFVELWGLDAWAKSDDPAQTKTVQDTIEEIYLPNLLPYTQYSVRVYVANEGGLRNPEMPLVMRGRTMAVRPAPPTDLKLTPAQNSIHAHWRPPHPPTGRVEKYVVRLGINNTDGKFGDSEVIWRRRIEVKPACKDTVIIGYCDTVGEWQKCHDLSQCPNTFGSIVVFFVLNFPPKVYIQGGHQVSDWVGLT